MSISEGTILKVVGSLIFAESSLLQNVFTCLLVSAGTSDDEEDVVSDLVDWVDAIYTHMDGRVSDTIEPGEYKVYQYDAIDDDWDEVGSLVGTFSPVDATDMLPHGVAFLVNAQTTDPDVQGRKYLGGLGELMQTDGLWTATCLSEMIDWADEWVTQFVGAATAATFNPIIWSPTRSTPFDLNGSYVLNALPAYQRRRKPGVGA